MNAQANEKSSLNLSLEGVRDHEVTGTRAYLLRFETDMVLLHLPGAITTVQDRRLGAVQRCCLDEPSLCSRDQRIEAGAQNKVQIIDEVGFCGPTHEARWLGRTHKSVSANLEQPSYLFFVPGAYIAHRGPCAKQPQDVVQIALSSTVSGFIPSASYGSLWLQISGSGAHG